MCAQLPCAFFEQAKSAVTSVRKALDPDVTGPRRMLVLINPYGGGGKARGVWRRLSALLSHADIEFEVIETTHAGHAREMMGTLQLENYAAICPVSGDGLIYEIVNGLLARPDGFAAAAAMPIAPVPGGTGNGLWRSIVAKAGEKRDLVGAAFVIVKGRPAPLDLWEYVRPGAPSPDGQPGPETHIGWSMLSLAWGLIADADLESEVMRWAGPLRNDLYPLWRIASLRNYAGKLSYLDAASGAWLTIEASDWVGLWACNVPYMTEDMQVAPHASFDDGCIDVLVMTGSTRTQMLGMFLTVGENGDGKHLNGGGLKHFKAKALRLEPAPRTPSKPGLLALDGEEVSFGTLEARPFAKALRVLV